MLSDHLYYIKDDQPVIETTISSWICRCCSKNKNNYNQMVHLFESNDNLYLMYNKCTSLIVSDLIIRIDFDLRL